MHEKDIQLARLLIERQTELTQSGEALRQQQREVEQRMAEVRAAVEERNQYADILAKAADLLQRSDLTVEEPDTAAEEAELAGVTQQLSELEAQEAQFRELVEALRERAPQLFDAATGELSLAGHGNGGNGTADNAAEAQTDDADDGAAAVQPDAVEAEPEQQEIADAAEQTGAEDSNGHDGGEEDWDQDVKVFVAGGRKELTPEDEEYLARQAAREAELQVAEEEAPAGAAAASAPDEPLTDEELERFLARFNMDAIQRQVLQLLGPDAVFVVDAASVMNNIPYYDNAIRGGPVKFIRDEMLRDFGLLGRHLGRAIHLVLDHEHVPESGLLPGVSLQTLRGGDQGQRSAQDTLLKSVLADAAQRTQVCLVTGELSLGGSLRSRRVQFLPVTDFFRM